MADEAVIRVVVEASKEEAEAYRYGDALPWARPGQPIPIPGGLGMGRGEFLRMESEAARAGFTGKKAVHDWKMSQITDGLKSSTIPSEPPDNEDKEGLRQLAADDAENNAFLDAMGKVSQALIEHPQKLLEYKSKKQDTGEDEEGLRQLAADDAENNAFLDAIEKEQQELNKVAQALVEVSRALIEQPQKLLEYKKGEIEKSGIIDAEYEEKEPGVPFAQPYVKASFSKRKSTVPILTEVDPAIVELMEEMDEQLAQAVIDTTAEIIEAQEKAADAADKGFSISKLFSGGLIKGALGAAVGGELAKDILAVDDWVKGTIKAGIGLAKTAVTTVISASTDPADSVAKFGDALSKVGDQIPILGQAAVFAGESLKAFAAVMHALDETVVRYSEYSPALVQAQAVAEIRQVMGDLRRAQEVTPELVKYIEARADLQQKWEDLKAKFIVMITPMVTRILEMLEMIMPSGQGIENAITGLMPSLALIPGIGEEIAKAIQDAMKPPIDDPTSVLDDPRFTQVGIGNIIDPGLVPRR